MYDEVITLIKREPKGSTDSGDRKYAEGGREVFVEVRSVGMSEKYKALAEGLELEFIFVLSDRLDYEGETEIEYEGTGYSVSRAYRNPKTDEFEIVAKR